MDGPISHGDSIMKWFERSMHMSLPSSRKLISVMGLALILCAFAVSQSKPEEAAEKSARSWLALVDSGKYDQSWDEAAEFFKHAVSKAQWQSMLQSTRTPLGKLTSRKLKSATYTKSLPGAPDGEYVVIQYDSAFENKQPAIETVTPMLDKDGIWRVSGYFIK
jgi:hypothetical protein